MVRRRPAVAGDAHPRRIEWFEYHFREFQPNRKTTLRVAFLFGGLEEIRTPDPRNANAMRSQLRYKPGYVEIISLKNIFVKKKEALCGASFHMITG